MKYLAMLFCLFTVATPALAAPRPWGLALNLETKQCAGFWGGDEFTQMSLPPGWQDYYADFGKDPNHIKTEIGTCTVTEDDEFESCCEQLGYDYVSNNIGYVSTRMDPDEAEKMMQPSSGSEEAEDEFPLPLTISAAVIVIAALVIIIKKR